MLKPARPNSPWKPARSESLLRRPLASSASKFSDWKSIQPWLSKKMLRMRVSSPSVRSGAAEEENMLMASRRTVRSRERMSMPWKTPWLS